MNLRRRLRAPRRKLRRNAGQRAPHGVSPGEFAFIVVPAQHVARI